MTTGSLVRTQSRHGPSSDCSWNSSRLAAGLVGGGHEPQLARGGRSARCPPRRPPLTRVACSHSVTRKSTTSKSATRVSATSTNRSERCSVEIMPGHCLPWCQGGPSRPPRGVGELVLVGHGSSVPRSAASTGHDVGGEFLERDALGEGDGAHPRQRHVERARRVDHDHALGLVDLVVHVHGGAQLGVGMVAGRRAVEQQLGGHLGEDQAGAQLPLVQRPCCGPDTGEHAEAHRPELQREREDGRGCRARSRPTRSRASDPGCPQVGDEHRPSRRRTRRGSGPSPRSNCSSSMPRPGRSEPTRRATDDPAVVITVTETWSRPSSRAAARHSRSRPMATSGTTFGSAARTARVCSRNRSPWSSVTR